MLNKLSIKINVVVPSDGSETEWDSTKELTEDLLSIIAVCMARHHGQRTGEGENMAPK